MATAARTTLSSLVLPAESGGSDELISGFTNPQVLHACRDLLRRLDRPMTLRSNILLEATTLGSAPHGVLCEALREVVTEALDSLSRREATIISRCDMLGESFALVASDLGISTRQLFRDRARALTEITLRILSGSAHISTHATTTAPLETLVRSAEALVQCGAWRAAAEMLERGVGSLERSTERTGLVLSLGELYLEAGRVTLAQQHIESALGTDASFAYEWQHLYAQALQGRLTSFLGDARAADVPLRATMRRMRRLVRTSPSRETAETFARSLIIRSEVDFKLGKIADATAATREALDALASLEIPNAFLTLEVRVAAALCRLFSWSDTESAQLELSRCYAEAIDRGYLRESVFVSTHLSGYFRLSGQLERSLHTVNAAMPIARATGAGEPLGALQTEQGWTLLMMGRYKEALEALSEARSHFCSNRELEAVTELLSARAWAGSGCPERALAAAEAVETTFTQMGRRRLAGLSLLVQAEALQRLARTDAAYRTAQAAFEVLRSSQGENSPSVLRASGLVKALAFGRRRRPRQVR